MTDHIKIPDVEPIAQYVADGVQVAYNYNFPIFASADLEVYLDGARQMSGFTITGAGETAGGAVEFDSPPVDEVIITLKRNLPIERVSDFIQGGGFAAATINNELDYLTAVAQQIARETGRMLRYDDLEPAGELTLPSKHARRSKALGFDFNGDPIAVSLEDAMAAPDYTATGMGAVTRNASDKFADGVSVRDFGALGDGLTDDTLAIQQALTAHDAVFLPAGEYLITGTIALREGQSLIGVGAASRIKCATNSFTAIEVRGGFNRVQNFAIDGGLIGISLRGAEQPCVQNAITDIDIIAASTGIQLDGYTDSAKPCYWNNIDRVLIEQPLLHGVHLTLSGLGDTPNANRFSKVRVFSKGALTGGSGFYIEQGALNNAFVDCEANVNGTSADSCVRVGSAASDTLITNMLCESSNLVSNLKLDSGSSNTVVMNLTAMSDGAAIEDLSGGDYTAINAGFPEKNTLRKTSITDLKTTLMRYDTEFIDTAGLTQLDASHSMHIVNAINGAITVRLPNAADANGVLMSIKKVDNSDNVVIIDENAGNGPDGKTLQLGEENDYAMLLSNGAAWYVLASNRAPGSTLFMDTSGTVDIDMAVDTYLVSSFSGALITRLPPADAAEAIGRTITIKKTDPSTNPVTITEQGGAGPDQSSHTLSSRYEAITVVSNGAEWYVVSRYS